MRIKFQDNGNIRNQMLIYGEKVFPKPTLFYDKVFMRNGAEIKEEYINGEMHSYFEKREERYFTITRGFTPKHLLFHTEVLYLKQNGKPYMCYNEVLTIDNVLEKHYRKVSSENKYSYDGFDTFEECLKYKPH